jgi:hypothetical protein
MHPGENQKIERPKATKVIACEVFRDELKHLGVRQSDCTYLEQRLHRYPDELNQSLIENIRRIEAESSPRRIILVYGYCGGGLRNISTKQADLYIAMVHDCIPLLIGHEPDRIGPQGKGTYFLSRGLIKHGQTPFTEYHELKETYGHEDAFWSCKELIKMYDRVAFIHTVPNPFPEIKKRSEKFACFFGMQHLEIQGDFHLLQLLLKCQPHENIIRVRPGCRISKQDFNAPPDRQLA